MLFSILLLAFPLVSAATHRRDDAPGIRGTIIDNVIDGAPCDESFPIASPASLRNLPPKRRLLQGDESESHRHLVAIIPDGDEDDETNSYQSYAPLCEDGKHIDIRKLMQCNGGSCWSEFYQVREEMIL